MLRKGGSTSGNSLGDGGVLRQMLNESQVKNGLS
jgi:hypothetical protein